MDKFFIKNQKKMLLFLEQLGPILAVSSWINPESFTASLIGRPGRREVRSPTRLFRARTGTARRFAPTVYDIIEKNISLSGRERGRVVVSWGDEYGSEPTDAVAASTPRARHQAPPYITDGDGNAQVGTGAAGLCPSADQGLSTLSCSSEVRLCPLSYWDFSQLIWVINLG